MLSRDDLHRSWRAWLSYEGDDPGPWWLAHVWTILFCLAVAAGFTILGVAGSGRVANLATWWRWYQINVVISLIIGYTIQGLFVVARPLVASRLRRWKPWQRSGYFWLLMLGGVAIGWPLAVFGVLDLNLRRGPVSLSGEAVASAIVFCVFITFVFHQFFATKSREIEAEKRAAEAQLRLLQGQIEPHFLFNTLANVVSLIEADPPRARLMLESFVDYLRASLSGLGAATHTLGDEIDLIEAYLRIVKIRMEDRLQVSIDVPAALRRLPLPALILQPLVENAIVHGLEPQIAGGRIRVAAQRADDRLVLTVDDDGHGVGDAGVPAARAAGTGTALANIRERLRHTYGARAALTLEPAQPRGVRASLSLPAPSAKQPT